jgi:hypothetical protein
VGGWGGAHARFHRGGALALLPRVNGALGRRPPHGGRPAAPAHAPIAQLPRLSHGLPPSPRHAGNCAQPAAPRAARAPLRAARSPIRLRPPGPTRGAPPATAARRWTPETGRRQGTRKGAPGSSALNAAQRTWQLWGVAGGGRTRAFIGAAHSRCCHASTAPLGAALRTAAGPQPQRMRPLRSFPGSATGFPPVRGTLATAHSRQHRVPHAPPFGRPAAPSACAPLGQPAARPPLLQRAGGRPRRVEGRAPGKARRRLEAAAPSVQRRWQAATGAGAVGASGAVATHCVLARVWGHRPPRARLSLWRCCHPSSAPSGDAPNPQVSGSNAQAQRKQAGRRTDGTPACVGGQAGRFHITK